MTFRNEKGLTLIELLITIAVIAIVAAISVPVVSNVINASNQNALAAMEEQVDSFVAEGARSGEVTLNSANNTLEVRIDQDGDGTAEYLVKTFPLDSKYTVSENPTPASTSSADRFTVSANGVTGGTQTVGTTFSISGGDFATGSYLNDWGYLELMNVSTSVDGYAVAGATFTVVTDLGTYTGTISSISGTGKYNVSLDGAPAFGTAFPSSITFN